MSHSNSWVKQRNVGVWSSNRGEKGRLGIQRKQNGERLLRSYPSQDHFSAASNRLPASLWRKRSGDLSCDTLSQGQGSSSSSSVSGMSSGAGHSAAVMEVPKDLDAMFDSKKPSLSIAMVTPESGAGNNKSSDVITGKAITTRTDTVAISGGGSLASGSDRACGLHAAIDGAEKANHGGMMGGKLGGVARGKLLRRHSPARDPVEYDVSMIGTGCQDRKDCTSLLTVGALGAADAEVSRKAGERKGLGRGHHLHNVIENRPDVNEPVPQESTEVTKGAKCLVSEAPVESSPIRNLVDLSTSLVSSCGQDEKVHCEGHSNDNLGKVPEVSSISRSSNTTVSTDVRVPMNSGEKKGMGRGRHLLKLFENEPEVPKLITQEKNAVTKLENYLVHERSAECVSSNEHRRVDKVTSSSSATTKRSGVGRGQLLQHLIAIKSENTQTEVGSGGGKEKSCDVVVESAALSVAELDSRDSEACPMDSQPTVCGEAGKVATVDDGDDDDLCIGKRTKAEVEQRIIALQRSIRIQEKEIKTLTHKNKAMEKELKSEMSELQEDKSEALPYISPERLKEFDRMIHVCGNARVAAMALTANKSHKNTIAQKCSDLLGNNKLARQELELVIQEEAIKKQLKAVKMENTSLQKKLDFYVNCR